MHALNWCTQYFCLRSHSWPSLDHVIHQSVKSRYVEPRGRHDLHVCIFFQSGTKMSHCRLKNCRISLKSQFRSVMEALMCFCHRGGKHLTKSHFLALLPTRSFWKLQKTFHSFRKSFQWRLFPSHMGGDPIKDLHNSRVAYGSRRAPCFRGHHPTTPPSAFPKLKNHVKFSKGLQKILSPKRACFSGAQMHRVGYHDGGRSSDHQRGLWNHSQLEHHSVPSEPHFWGHSAQKKIFRCWAIHRKRRWSIPDLGTSVPVGVVPSA